MTLGIFFDDDLTARLEALSAANERALALAERYGMNPEVARLCQTVYQGALKDVGASFGLDLGTALAIPTISHEIVTMLSDLYEASPEARKPGLGVPCP